VNARPDASDSGGGNDTYLVVTIDREPVGTVELVYHVEPTSPTPGGESHNVAADEVQHARRQMRSNTRVGGNRSGDR